MKFEEAFDIAHEKLRMKVKPGSVRMLSGMWNIFLASGKEFKYIEEPNTREGNINKFFNEMIVAAQKKLDDFAFIDDELYIISVPFVGKSDKKEKSEKSGKKSDKKTADKIEAVNEQEEAIEAEEIDK